MKVVSACVLLIGMLFLLGCAEVENTNVETEARAQNTVEPEPVEEVEEAEIIEEEEESLEEIEQERTLDEDNEVIKETVQEPEEIEEDEEEVQQKSVVQATKLATNYYRYDKAHYEQSLADGKIIFLDFHANWCPICKREQPHIFAAFEELDDENIVGYEVHYNDKETNDDDREAAKKYGITYQHTKVVIDSNGNVVSKSLESFNKQKVLTEIAKAN